MPGDRKPSTRLLIPIAFGCVYFFWGSTFVAIRYGVRYLTPGFVSGFRYLIAGLLILPFLAVRGKPVALRLGDFRRVLLMALLMLTGNNVLLGWSERYLSAGYAALLAAAIPLMIAVGESIIPGGKPLNHVGWAGTALGVCGLAMLLWPVLRHGLGTASAGDRGVLLGTCILMVGNLCWVAGSIYSGRRHSTMDPVRASGWQMVVGGIINILIGTAAGGWQTAHWNRGVFFAVGWLAIFGSLVAYSAYTFLLHTVPVAKVATYAYVNPVVAVVLSAVFLHEGLRGLQWVAMALILVAVAIVTASKSMPGRMRLRGKPKAFGD